MTRRIISVLLTILMLLTMIPIAVSAASEECEWTVDGGDTQAGAFTAAIAAANSVTGTYDIKLLTSVTANVVINTASTINLNMNSFTLSAANRPIKLFKGTLNITGTGLITETVNDGYAPILLKGSTNAADTDYTVLSVGSGVTLRGWSGLFIDQNSKKAYGVKVDFNGTILTPAESHTAPGYAIYANGNIQDATNCPVITIGTSAHVTATGTEATAIYAAGYAVWTINGGSFSATGTIIHLPNGDGASTSGHALALVENKTHSPPL